MYRNNFALNYLHKFFMDSNHFSEQNTYNTRNLDQIFGTFAKIDSRCKQYTANE